MQFCSWFVCSISLIAYISCWAVTWFPALLQFLKWLANGSLLDLSMSLMKIFRSLRIGLLMKTVTSVYLLGVSIAGIQTYLHLMVYCKLPNCTIDMSGGHCTDREMCIWAWKNMLTQEYYDITSKFGYGAPLIKQRGSSMIDINPLLIYEVSNCMSSTICTF